MFVSDMIGTIKNIVEVSISSNVTSILHAISPTFFAAIGLYVCFIAYEIIYSQRDVIMSEVTKTIMAFGVVGVFTYSGDYYSRYVIPFVLNAGQDLSSSINGGGDVAGAVEHIWTSISASLEQMRSEIGVFDMDIHTLFLTGSIWLIGMLSGAVLVIYSTLFLCVSIFLSGVLLSVGPIFISFALFPSTRSMFTSWVGSCLNFTMLNVFYTISFGFVVAFIEKYSEIDPKAVNIIDVVSLLGIVIVSVILIEQVGSLCAALTNGVAANGISGVVSGGLSRSGGALMRASGMRAFSSGFNQRMGSPFSALGRRAASSIQSKAAGIYSMASRSSSIKGG